MTAYLTDPVLIEIKATALNRAHRAIIEAREQIRDAIQMHDLANVIWWEKALKARQNWLRHVEQW